MILAASLSLVVAATQQSSGHAAIQADAKAISWLAQTSLGHEFISSAAQLTAVAKRQIYRHKQDRTWMSPIQFRGLSSDAVGDWAPMEVSDDVYYQTKYGSPLTYLRAMDLLGGFGIRSLAKRKILDFGYGTIGQLRLFALMGANAVGIDVDPFLSAIYCFPEDQGRYGPGSVRLIQGFFPSEPKTAASVGGGYDLILSKNTLKLGYIHPRRTAPKEQLIHLGVSDELFVRELWDRLNPGGCVMIYNICPPQNPPEQAYIPWADGESPFARSIWEKQGFDVLAFNQTDNVMLRALFKGLGYDSGPNGKQDLNATVFTWYSVFRKPTLAWH